MPSAKDTKSNSSASATAGATKESKYERVEKVNVDSDGSTMVKEVGEDRGKEDPGMNFADKRPANLVPGAPAGSVPMDRASMNSSNSSSGYVDGSMNRGGSNTGEYSSTSSTTTQRNTTGGSVGSGSQHSHTSERDTRQTTGQPIVGSTQVMNQRTIVTESHQTGGQRTVPIQPHREVREDHEVIQHESHRTAETRNVSIPITSFQGVQMETERHGRTFTEDKALTIPAPTVAPEIHARQQVSMGGGTHAEITASTNMQMASEAEIKDMGPEEYARYRAKVESLARQHEQMTSQKAAEYRTEVEHDAELIRQTLERQHVRDIEFRKDMVESSVDRQQVEIQLEAEYALRALEREREAARSALERAKASTNIDVNIDSAIGTTHSQGRVTTTTEKTSSTTTNDPKARDPSARV